jgi:hypothetical protein
MIPGGNSFYSKRSELYLSDVLPIYYLRFEGGGVVYD